LDRSLAYQCYLMCWNQSIVIPLWNLKDEVAENDNILTWVDSVNVLTKLLYDREKNEKKPAIYSFKQMRSEIISKDFRLSSFFDSIYNASFPKERSNKDLDKLDKKLAVECYIICGNRNSKLTTFKKDVSLFVDLMGVSMEAIDALSHAGITISRRHLDREKIAIADNHSHRIAPNGISVHNLNLVDFNLICNFLDTYYMRRMSKTFNDQFYREVPLDKKLENMTLHKYDSRIQERQEKRKMKDTILLDFFELSLKNMDSYINALRE
ncbi:13535_t:CDS:2, partial [Racocetra persica]